MAKCLGPALALETRGTIGPIVFSRSRYGTIIKPSIDQYDRFTPEQTDQRAGVFARAAYQWENQPKSIIDLWIDFSRNYPVPDVFGTQIYLSPRDWFMRFYCRFLRFNITPRVVPPLTPTCDYHPTMAVAWTVSGARLTFAPAIPADNRIIVRQMRNLCASNIAPVMGSISHVFTESDTSPELISPAAGPTGGPGTQPGFNAGSYIHFFLQSIDDYGRASPRLFFPILTS